MRLRWVAYGILVLLFASCGSTKTIKKQKKKGVKVVVEPKPIKLPSVQQNKHIKSLERTGRRLNRNTLNYIRKWAPLAVREMHTYKIPASITLAQGILESGSGKSQLAAKSKNHFGIKCHTGWKGGRVYHDDDARGECFRKYQFVESSYEDHSKFLTQRRRYAFLFSYGSKNYKKWAKGLKKAGYATDPKYPRKLISLIENYELYKFDDVRKKDLKYVDTKPKKQKPKKVKASRRYTVKRGDTLYSISRRFGMTVDDLKQINGLRSNTISIGQELKVK
jgi:flagellum-specific peptidoglycan hydrolase FlgJ